MDESLRSAARAAGNHPVVEKGARLGYAASGLLHLVIAWLALEVAWNLPGSAGDDADQTGALRAIADTAIGGPLLWTAAAGFALLGLWNLVEAVVRRDTAERLKAAGKAAVYAALVVTTFQVLGGSERSGAEQTSSTTASFLQTTVGRVAVAVVGIGLIGVAVYHVVKGVRRGFLRDLQEHPGRWAVRAGTAGYVAKGVALGLVGGLFIFAATQARAAEATGLDGALRAVLDLPLGPVLLTAVALGLACYGVYSFARARFARV